MTDTTIDFYPEQLTLMGRVCSIAAQAAQSITADTSSYDCYHIMADHLRSEGLSIMQSVIYPSSNYGAFMVSSRIVVMVFHDEAMVRPHFYITQDFLHASCCQQPALILNFAHSGELQVEYCRYDRDSRVMTIGS